MECSLFFEMTFRRIRFWPPIGIKKLNKFCFKLNISYIRNGDTVSRAQISEKNTSINIFKVNYF